MNKFIRAADQRLDDYLRRLDEGDVEEGGTGGAPTKNLAETIAVLREKRGHYEVMSAELERTGEAHISLTDPDCRAMAAHTKVGVGYNIQVAVDAKHKMIVEQAMGKRPHGPHVQVRCSQPMPTRQHCLYLRMEMTSSEREGVGCENFAGPTLPCRPR